MLLRSAVLRFTPLVVLAACGGGGDATEPAAGPPASVAVTIPASTLVLGDTVRATALVKDARGLVVSVPLTWRSSAPNVLDVNPSTGLVKALALDTASVIATVSGASGSAVTGSTRLTVRPPSTATVSMTPNAFIPFSLVLAVGGAVTYDFPPGMQHNVIFPKKASGQPQVAGAPPDILPTQNVKVTRQFNTAGTFSYDCTIHPGMTGEVIVVP